MTAKIKIEADVSTLDQQIADVKRKLSEVNGALKDGTYKVDTTQAQKDFKALNEQIVRLRNARDELFKNDKLSSGQAQQTGQLFNQFANTADQLTRSGTINPNNRAQWGRRESLDSSDFQNQIRGQNRQQSEEQQAREARYRSIAQVASGIAGAAIGGGGAGSLAGGQAGALFGKLVGMPFGLPGQLVGSALGGAIGGKLGGMSDSGLSDAEKEAVDYSQLRHMLGSTSVDFDRLRDSTRSLVDGFNVTYNESVQLAKEFAHTAATKPGDDSASALGKSIHDALGFAQAYGVAPQATTQFLANQQLYQVSNNETDNKKLALQIGEAVGRSGTTAKMDEVLAAITGFTQSTATQSLLTPDVSTYTSLLSTLMSSSSPGLNKNPTVAAGILNNIDSGFRNANSEPQNNFILGSLMAHNREFNAFDVNIAKEAGILATPADVYGKNSNFYRLAQDNNDVVNMAHADKLSQDHTPYLKIILDNMLNSTRRSDGSVDTAQAARYGQTMFNAPQTQIRELLEMYQNDKGFDLEKKLKPLGIDAKTVDLAKVPTLVALADGGDKAYQDQYKKLIEADKIKSGSETKTHLDTLLKENKTKEFNKEILNLTLKNDSDIGREAQQAQVSMSNNMQKLVDGLIPLTTAIKEGIVQIVKLFPDFTTSDSAKAFVAKQELLEYSNGISLGKKSPSGQPVDENKAALELSKLSDTESSWFKNKDSLRNEFTRVKENALKNPEQYPAEYPKALDAFAKENHLLESDPEQHLGKDVSIPFSGKSLSGKPLQDFTYSNMMAKRLLIISNRGDREGLERMIGINAKQVQENPEMFDEKIPEFLDNLYHRRGEVNDIYQPKPQAATQDYKSVKSATDSSEDPDSTLKPSIPFNQQGIDVKQSKGFKSLSPERREVAEKVIDEARRQGNTPVEQAKLAGLVEYESTFKKDARGPVIQDSTSIHYGDRAHGPFQIMAATANSSGINRDNLDENIRWGVTNANKFARKLRNRGLSPEDAFDKGLASNLTGQGHSEYYENRFPKVRDANGTDAGIYVDTANANARKFLDAEPKPDAARMQQVERLVTETTPSTEKQLPDEVVSDDSQAKAILEALSPFAAPNLNQAAGNSLNQPNISDKATSANKAAIVAQSTLDKAPGIKAIKPDEAPKARDVVARGDIKAKPVKSDAWINELAASATYKKTVGKLAAVMPDLKVSKPNNAKTEAWVNELAASAKYKPGAGALLSSDDNRKLLDKLPGKESLADNMDKIPADVKTNKPESQSINVKHAPLSLSIALTDPRGNPLTNQVVSSHFSAPRPAGS